MNLTPQIHASDIELDRKERLALVLELDRRVDTKTRSYRNKSEARTHAREIFYHVHDSEAVRCADCREDKRLEVHHADGDPHNNDWKNLVGLCRECHRTRHHGD